MSGGSDVPARDPVFAHFAKLVALPSAVRADALEALDLSCAERSELAQLLAADDRPDEELAAALARGVAGSLSPARRGDRLGPWRVLEEIGAGGMGTVFLGERADGAFEQKVAIKLLRGFPTEDGRRRLRQERQLLAQLDHPYIAHLIDAGETDDGQPYFIMEYVEGKPAPAHVSAMNLDLKGRVQLLDRIAEAVAHAHQRLVVHRDLKPSNVLVRDDGTPRLLDFGVAKLIELGASAQDTSTRVWTPGYASPEQKQGGAVTTATDVFALGTLLRELISGRTPSGDPCVPALAAVTADVDLQGIMLKATSERPDARYRTVEALRDDLSRWQKGRPVRAARNTVWYRMRKFVRRHRLAVVAASLATVALSLFVWRLDVERQRARLAEALASQQRSNAEQSAATTRSTLDFFGGLIAELSPDGDIDTPITLRRMLERGRDRIAREVPEGSPQAPLVNTYLGSIHHLLGEPADAEPLLRSGLDAMTVQGFVRGTTFGRAARDYAILLAEVGRLPESAEWLAQAAQAFRSDPGSTSEAEAIASEVQAHIFGDRHAEAEQKARNGIAAARSGGASAEVIATLMQQRIVSLNALSRGTEAESASIDALALLEEAGLGRSMFAYQLEQELGKAQLNLHR
ncbi:MAG: serine/threonine-protein kinase, partial [Dokdonella sp.]